MSEVLSAQETAALLDGIEDGSVDTSEETPQGTVRRWDLREQDAIVRGRYPALERANEHLARELSARLPGLFRQLTEVRYAGLRKEKHGDYMKGLRSPCALNILSVAPLAGNAMLVMDTDLVFLAVDSYFSGPCRQPEVAEDRALTATEVRIVELLRAPVLEQLDEVWRSIRKLDFKPDAFDCNPAFVELVPAAQELLVSRFTVTFGEHESELHLVLPLQTIDPIVRVLDGRAHIDIEAERAAWQGNLRNALLDVQVDVSADLTRLPTDLRRVLSVQAGDVIPFDMPEAVTVESGGRPLFQARFGASRNRNAVLMTALPEENK